MTRASQVALAVAVAAGALLVNDNMSLTQPSSLVSQSEARVGRPLSPGSVAGVARRQTRRGMYDAGIVGAGVVGTGAAIGAARYRGGYADDNYGYRQAVGTGAALAATRYGGAYAAYGDNGYGGWSTGYMERNGIICEPGSTVRFPDGVLYLCQ